MNSKIDLILLITLMGFACSLAAENTAKKPDSELAPKYNQSLAEQFGADDYGMKMYVMAFLKAGPNRDRSEKEAAELQKAHMTNIKRMAENGDLVLAGPFGKNELGMRGIYIFNVQTVEEAKALTESDPAIKAGSLVMELIPWYGSAAVMQINKVHQTLAKKGM